LFFRFHAYIRKLSPLIPRVLIEEIVVKVDCPDISVPHFGDHLPKLNASFLQPENALPGSFSTVLIVAMTWNFCYNVRVVVQKAIFKLVDTNNKETTDTKVKYILERP
jgi:hypothetical protein